MTRKLPNVSCWGYSSTLFGLHLNIDKRCVSSLADEAHLFLRWIKLAGFNGKRYGTICHLKLCAVSVVSQEFYFLEARVLDTSSQ
ncbi:hypothetical protein SAMN05428961_103511 [Paenibacillus sp. OK060]|nr:hypothetical protein gpAD87_25665 [Paenibacillus sp. AD87]SDK99801.1 hypothetical protein SAMN05428961_103511 [Paenibacillus sp. OK060]